MPLSALPDDRRPAVEAAIARAFPGAATTALTPIRHGRSGAPIYRLELDGAPYLLRLEVHADAMRDPARHHACLRLAAEAGVAPRAHWLDPAAGVAITDFVEGPSLHAVPRGPRNQAIARTVATLHASPRPFPAGPGFFEAMGLLADAVEQTGILPREVLGTHLDAFGAVAAGYPRDEAPVPCHHDLNPSNMLLDEAGRVWLVDWELAGAGDRWVDLASLTLWLAADDAEEAAMVEAYLDRGPTLQEAARYAAMRRAVRWYYGLGLLMAAAAQAPGKVLTAAELDAPALAQIRPKMGEIGQPGGAQRFGCAFLAEAMRAPA